jgi:CheY-like chemotaxis protein
MEGRQMPQQNRWEELAIRLAWRSRTTTSSNPAEDNFETPASCNAVRRVDCDALTVPPLRVLIVDDSRGFLAAARRLLEQESLEVVDCALTSADALRLAERLAPDVVLVDVMLAGESGLTLARHLADLAGANPPAVILISTHAEEDLAGLLEDTPAAGFVAKADLCASAIEQILSSKGR